MSTETVFGPAIIIQYRGSHFAATFVNHPVVVGPTTAQEPELALALLLASMKHFAAWEPRWRSAATGERSEP